MRRGCSGIQGIMRARMGGMFEWEEVGREWDEGFVASFWGWDFWD